MKCPHCEYTNPEVDELHRTETKGSRGGFFVTEWRGDTVLKRQENPGGPIDTVSLVGCPLCKKVFIK